MTNPAQKRSQVKISYFELQAHLGTTKHMGGLETTQKLIELCHVSETDYVLEVGCGVGATACYLARTFGCRVVGLDLRESMVARCRERAKRDGVTDRVEFRVADALHMPFPDALFDVVVCESVATFIEDKQRVVSECVRVSKPGGHVGLNEEIWLQVPPPELILDVQRIWDVKAGIPTRDGWLELLVGAGLQDVVAQVYEFDARREATQLQRYRFEDMWRMFHRTLALYLRNPTFRTYIMGRQRLPKDVFNYLGYALFVGRKARQKAQAAEMTSVDDKLHVSHPKSA
jgi:arsenite methyltransferase